LIETNALPLHQTANRLRRVHVSLYYIIYNIVWRSLRHVAALYNWCYKRPFALSLSAITDGVM